MRKEVQDELIGVFGERVAFHNLERMLYSCDLGTMPEILRSQIVATPDAVVQPVSSEDLVALVNVAMKFNIPLVPRGSGTAIYGGAVPTMGGIVVDFYRMKKVVDIRKDADTVAVQPGITWSNLNSELRSHNLTLRLYPRSAHGSTVGGWLANGGGVGIGSFEYGYLRDNVVEVEIITPKETKRLRGDDLDLVYGMAGTTGLISEVTLLVRDREDDIFLLGAFSSVLGLIGSLREVKETKLPLWEASFRDPLHIQLNRMAEEEQAKRKTASHAPNKPHLPEGKFIAMFAYPKSREAKVEDQLLNVIHSQGGEAIGDGLARYAWDERFYPMRFKALKQSLSLTEAIVNMDELLLIDDARARVKGMAVNGTMINHAEEAFVQIYVSGDENSQESLMPCSKTCLPPEIAGRLGGRPYTIGMYFTDDAELLLGKDKLIRTYDFKNQVDPSHIMNPGKVFPSSLDKDSPIEKFNRKFKSMQARESPDANEVSGSKFNERGAAQSKRLEELQFGAEVKRDAVTCVKCGYCRSVCPQFETIGWESASPRGKYNFIREYLKGNAQLDVRMAEMFFVCTTCHRCNDICQIGATIDEDWTLTMRQAILREGFRPPLIFQRQVSNIIAHHNPGGFPQTKRLGWMTPDLKTREDGEVGYFVGCAATFTYGLRNLPIHAIRILNKAGIEPAYLGPDEWCCGGPMFSVGFIEEVLDTVEHNINEMNKRGIRTIITSCSGGWLNLNQMYRLLAKRLGLQYDVNVKHITEVISDLIGEGRIKCERPVNLRVTYHDPCHIGRGGGIFDKPRRILASIPGIELIEMPRHREDSACCGKNINRYPRLGGAINKSRVNEALQTGASALVTCCPTCENNLRAGMAEAGAGMEVLDISDLVAESMGLPRLAVSKLSRLLRKSQIGG